MAVSVGNGVSSSISNVDGKKSLFLLRKIMSLNMLGCKAPNDSELNSTVGNLIDRYLKTPDQDSEGIKKELQGLMLVQPSLGNYSVKEIFHTALSKLIGVKLDGVQEKHLNRIYMEQFLTWIQEEIKYLPEASHLLLLNIYYSFTDLSIDLDTSIWQELLSLKWNASQKESLNQFKSKYESLRFCALKTPLIEIKNTRGLLIESTKDIKKDIKKIRGLYISWRHLLEMIVPYLDKGQKKYIVKSLNRSKKLIREGNEILDKEFIMNTKDMIGGILSNFQGIREEYRSKLLVISSFLFIKVCELCSECSRDCLEDRDDQAAQGIQTILDNHLQDTLKRANEETRERQKIKTELEYGLQRIQSTIDKITLIMEKEEETLSPIEKKEMLIVRLSLENNKREISLLMKEEESYLELVSTSHKRFMDIYEKCIPVIKGKEHLINKEEVQRFERSIRINAHDLTLKERSFSSIIFLGQELTHLLLREELFINQLEEKERLAYEAATKKSEGCFKKHAIPSKKSAVKTRSVVEDFSTSSESISVEDSEEKSSISSFSESSDSILENMDLFNGMNSYLLELKKGKNIQLNGLLSQTVDGFLQTLKTHLLKIKTPDDLKDQCDLQTREIFDHLLLGTAGLELLVQAVCDQKTDHIALGFRNTLLHCYYAIEQKLSQRSIEINEVLDKVDQKHNLLYLAKRTKITDLKRWQNFLHEMTLHVAFSYPGEHRFFFQQKYKQKAFFLLDDLSSPNFDNNKLKEVIEFCFEMYSKSIAFITEISSFPIENQPNFLGIIQDLKEQIIRTLYELPTKKILSAQSGDQLQELGPILVKVKQILSTLQLSLKNLEPLIPCFGEKEQKMYTAMDTMQNYLEFMGSSLEISQNSSQHSLQKFLKIEVLVNIDKLFKHLFRVAILLKKGEDEHQHALVKLFASIADFYKRKDEQAILSHLKDINLSVSHHYLHVSVNYSKLYSIYKKSLSQAYSLLHISDEYTVVSKKVKKSAKDLQENIGKVNELVNRSLNLFMELLEPTLEKIKEQYLITAIA